ncbi:hypothetical protein HPG69_014403 [Diceros bicornis minor]|uniref:SAM domain-containing protein n=1 Tax=Diceros bicornis minor TaxID=77932 RepID=A0A7J7EWH5_DICBM|nr:hypothetical protein HPG69_014403 [Diceros bicornis minor]
MTESASSTSGQEFDVFSVMDWKDGVGTLPGSDLKFRVNEFGALEVITDESEMENVKKATATTTWMVPTAQEVFSEKTGMPFRLKDPVKVDGLQFCENCCQYGNVDECLSGGNYCSQNCARHMKDKDQKEERDTGEDNEEEDPKCSRKKKPKLSLKADSKEDGEERDDEMENKQDGRILRGSQRARRKRRGDATVLKQGLPPKGKKTWCWASYLEEEKAVAVPAKLFKEYQSFPYNKNGFKVGMKLEGVDPEHQSVYCVLTVAEVCGYRIKLHFDGYSDCYDFWTVIPSGFRVGMKLEAVDKKNPAFICVATVTDMVDNRFLVHFDNWDESYDYCAANCPYSETNLNKDRIFPDRLSGEMPPASPSFPRNKRTDTNEISSSPEIRDQHADDVKEDFEERTESEMKTSHEARVYWLSSLDPVDLQTKTRSCGVRGLPYLGDSGDISDSGAREEPSVQQAQRRSAVFLSFKSPIPCLPLRWEQQSKLLPTVAGIPASKVSKWSTDEVSEFIQSLPGCEEHGKVFKDEQIDGEAFLLMTQTDIVKIMSIKLGPALKIFNSILMFKAAEKNSHNEL